MTGSRHHTPPDSPQAQLGLRLQRGHFGAVALFASITTTLTCIGWCTAFTSVAYFDDEGDWLLGIKLFIQHGSLYHNTYSQCGPFYYDFWWLVFTVTRLPITIDSGRLLGLATWLTISLLCGLLVWFVSRWLVLAAFAQIAAFFVMEGLVAEPLEPAGLGSLLIVLALVTVGCLWVTHRQLALALLGAIVAATVFTKVNLGLFLADGTLAAGLLAVQSDKHASWRRLGASVLLVGLPLSLCAPLLSRRWVETLVLQVVGGALALVFVSTKTPHTPDEGRPVESTDLALTAAGFATITLLVVAVTLSSGTTLSELVDGAILSQRHLASIFSIAPPTDSAAIPVTIASLASVSAFVLARRRPAWLRIFGRLGVGGFMVLTAAGAMLAPHIGNEATHLSALNALLHHGTYQPGPLAWGTPEYSSPLVWLAVRRPSRDGSCELSLFRLMVAAVAILLTLELFPVAGDQLSWSCLGLIIVGALIFCDGLRLVPLARSGGSVSCSRTRAGVWAMVATTGILMVCNLVGFAANYALLYDRNASLDLPGTALIRLPPQVVQVYRGVTHSLAQHCRAFYGLPGLNSFYFYLNEPPPTGIDTTQWMYLLGQATQQSIVAALRAARGLCVLYYPDALFTWEQGKPLPLQSPLLTYFENNFIPKFRISDFVVLVRSPKQAFPAQQSTEAFPHFSVPLGKAQLDFHPYFS